MELSNYLKSCSKVLLKKLCELSKDKKLIAYYEEYNKNLDASDDVDYSWSLISTSLLLSEHLWKTESVYTNISNITIENIEDELSKGTIPIKGDILSNNCLLDSKNLVANPINIEEIQDTYKLDENEMLTYKINKKRKFDELDSLEQSRLNFLDDIFENDVYGCNDALLTNGRMDYRKFIVRVRHALAHSNYEIIDNEYIRLYHYNKVEKKLDFNVALNKKLVITILDELNELYDESGKELISNWNDFRHEFVIDSQKELDDSVILDKLLAYDVFTESDCNEILKKAKKDKDYEFSDSPDKLDIILECMLEKLRPVCSYGIMVNELIYGNDNGLMASEYYEKFDYYNYFNSELFDINMDTNKENYDKHKFELLLFSFLNCILLNGVNLNNNSVLISLDFSKMEINRTKVEHDMNKKEMTDLINKLEKLEKQIISVDEYIRKRKTFLEQNKHLDNEFFNVKLPAEIKHFLKVKGDYLAEQNKILGLLQDIDLGMDTQKLTNYILTHLRNSLAHGYVKVNSVLNLNNVSDLELTFLDFEPNDKTKKTFDGTIILSDLLEILTSKEYLENIYGMFNDSVNKKRI